MKTKIKRHSRAVMSVILAVSMLISCMTVGLIASDAAKVDDEPLGYNSPAKIAISTSTSDLASNQHDVTITSNSGSYTVTGAAANTTYYFKIQGDNDVFGNASIGTNYNSSYNLGLITGGSLTDSNSCSRFTTTTAGDYEISFKIAGSSGSTVKVIKGASSSTECSTDGQYIVTGSQAITGTSSWQNTWSGATSRNQFVYDANLKCYKVEYKNVDALSSAALFRVLDTTDSTDWEQTMGYDQSTRSINPASIATVIKGSDNNFSMTSTQKTNITIYLDDSKSGTEMLTVIITPAVSTVTAGTQTGGTVKVNGGSSASNIAYNGTVSLTATPDDYYHFGSWDSNDYLTYTNANAATTTAAVTGTTTVTATFVKDSFTVTKGTGDGYTITAPATTNTSMQWDEDLTITANSDNMHYIDYLYYKVNNVGDEVKIGENADSNTTTLTRTLSMPKSNVTVYAHVHERETKTITYGITSDSPSGSGYVNAGKRHNTSTSQIEYSIESGSKVLEGTSVLFGARAAAGYKFLGWFANEDGSGSAVSTSGDYPVTANSADIELYAKFEQPTDPAVKTGDGVRFLFKYDDYKDELYNVYTWYNDGTDHNSTSDGMDGGWHGKSITSLETVTNGAGTEYYYRDYSRTSFNAIMNDSDSQGSGNITISSAGTYVISFDGGTSHSKSTYTQQTGAATTTYYPVKLEVTNPDKGSAYVEYFAAGGESKTVTHTPTDTENDKTQYVDNSAAAVKTTSTTHSLAMPADGTSTKTTVTFIPKEYYKVTFSAGAGGTISATAGGTPITSGTMVKEGTEIVFTAAPDTANGYTVAGWTGDVTSAIATTKTIAAASFTSAKTARVYFSKDKGTENTGTKFGYGKDNNPSTWTIINTYVQNGRVYAYIDSPDAATTYYFQAYQYKSSYSTEEKYTYQYYRNNENSWAVSDFDEDVYDINKYKRNSDYNASCNEIQFKVTSNVSGVKIDLGPVKSGTTGQADPYNDKNTYHIIPIYNTDVTNVTVYAKDGTYRGDDTDTNKYDYFPAKANTVISAGTGISNIAHHTNMDTAVAVKGSTVTVTTTITDATAAAKFYVRGFSFNGVTPQLLTPTANNVYTSSFTIPADFEDDYLEITPIYNFKDTVEGVTTIDFYIENYDEAFQNTGWGNQLAVYPYYSTDKGDVNRKDNAFGGYPGQPVINYGGRRFVQIATTFKTETNSEKDSSTYTTNQTATIKGITLSNYYFDRVHREYCREVDTHLQTYDYDDFYKIYRETTDGQEVNHTEGDGRDKTADQITFAFKHRTSYDNFGTTRYSGAFTKDTSVATALPSTITKSSFTNGWEDLLDYHDRPIDIFGKQLTTEQQNQDPLLVVSDGYEYTHAGYYATTWTVYTPTGTKIGTITPSALIIANSTRLANNTIYPDSAGRGGDYPIMMQLDDANSVSVYNTLKTSYANRPVLITYEKALSNADGTDYHKSWSEVSTRSDGRWYYSYMNEAIHANLKIMYRDSTDSEYSADTLTDTKTNAKGKVTGATVKFLDTTKSTHNPDTYEMEGYHDTLDYTEDTGFEVTSDQNDLYRFQATEGSGYIFDYWGFERDGIVTPVSPDNLKNKEGASGMTSNATFVAYYTKNPSGALNINHTLADNTVGNATTYISVVAIKDNVRTTLATDQVDTYAIDDPQYMSYKSGYKFEITLKTVINDDFTLFDRFSAGTGSENFFSTAGQSTSGKTTTTSFVVDVDDLFGMVDGFPKQTTEKLDYFSHLKTKELTYLLNYNYDAYVDSYGRQGYDVKGTLSYEDLNEYFKFADVAGYDEQKLVFNNTEGKKEQDTFLNKMAPYENNFMQNNYWNTSGATLDYTDDNYDLKVVINETHDLIDDVHVTLFFPYDFGSYSKKHAAVEQADGKVYKVDDKITKPGVTHKYNDVYSLNTTKRVDHAAGVADPEFIKAPDSIWSGENHDVQWDFAYWSVKTVHEDNGKHESVEYTRCYSKEFNFVLFQDIILEPVYKQVGDEEADTNLGATITFIENSRNQYNENHCGNLTTSSRTQAGDRIYSDFLISFADNMTLVDGKMLNTTTSGLKAGLIVETVGDIQQVDGKYVTKSDTEYKAEYGANLTEISSKLSGKDASGHDVTIDREAEIKSFIKNHTSLEEGNLIISEFDVSKLDNKNRVQYYYSLPNRKHQTLEDSLTRRFKVYRAYSYLRNADGTQIEISQVPVYFTIYDIGSIQNYAEAQAGGGYKS
ncbi:MAG: hypothetical protein IJT85_04590 [Ruminococcus sp.]|nr:hypothetical protein [Ruminococcus sp.]